MKPIDHQPIDAISTHGARIGDLGEQVLILDGVVVHRLTGQHAEVARALGAGLRVPGHLDGAVAELVDSGVINAPLGWTRRRVLTAAAVAGIGTLVLPSAAAAQSVPDSDGLFTQAAEPSNDDGPEAVTGIAAVDVDDEHGAVEVSWNTPTEGS